MCVSRALATHLLRRQLTFSILQRVIQLFFKCTEGLIGPESWQSRRLSTTTSTAQQQQKVSVKKIENALPGHRQSALIV